jgi:hypothetical protein
MIYDSYFIKSIYEYLVNNTYEKVAVDIGCSNNSYITGLFDYQKFCIDYDSAKLNQLPQVEKINKIVSKVTPNNVIELFNGLNIPQNFAFLNLDIDSYDFFVLNELLKKYKPYLICTEINEKFPPPIRFKALYDANLKYDGHFYGYSIMCLDEIIEDYGYDLVKLDYNNCFLIKSGINKFGKKSIEDAYHDGYVVAPDREQIFYYNKDMNGLLMHVSDDLKIKAIKEYFKNYEGKYQITKF